MTQSWLDDDTLAIVRPQVRQLLERSQGFRALPREEQRDMARTMVRVASFMANPHGLAKEELTPGRSLLAREQGAGQPLARAQDSAVDAAGVKPRRRLAPLPARTSRLARCAKVSRNTRT